MPVNRYLQVARAVVPGQVHPFPPAPAPAVDVLLGWLEARAELAAVGRPLQLVPPARLYGRKVEFGVAHAGGLDVSDRYVMFDTVPGAGRHWLVGKPIMAVLPTGPRQQLLRWAVANQRPDGADPERTWARLDDPDPSPDVLRHLHTAVVLTLDTDEVWELADVIDDPADLYDAARLTAAS